MVAPSYEYEDGKLFCGDVKQVLSDFPDESVHCIVTSPPYFGLRDYGTGEWVGGDAECDHIESYIPHTGDARKGRDMSSQVFQFNDFCGKCGAKRKDFQIGAEETPEEYIQRLVEVFRELRRVLRADGVAWLNLGDSYWGGKGRSGAGSPKSHHERTSATLQREHTYLGKQGGFRPTDRKHMVFKPKDLCLMPHRVAIALQEDGWWVRQDIVWHKPNPMPESVRDRCTKAHEYIFMLTKSKKYYYDHEAIKVPVNDKKRKNYQSGSRQHGKNVDRNDNDWGERSKNKKYATKNSRSVWKVPVFAYKGAHFATYPPKLIEPCILSSTSQAGHCGVCGSRWRRVIERKLKNKPDTAKSLIESAQHMGIPDDKAKLRVGLDRKSAYEKNPGYHTLGWEATCDCDSPTEPDVVLDPFMGSGTTAVVARQYGRHFIGIDLNAEYLELANKRISSNQKT